MPDLPASSRPGSALPGWGWRLRRWSSPSAALTLAAVLTLSGCAGAPHGATKSTQKVLSRPAGLRGALSLALRHVQEAAFLTPRMFSLVSFRGQGLDGHGMTTAEGHSYWEFVFSRDAFGAGAAYEYVAVHLPGTGPVELSVGLSDDPLYRPGPSWHAALDSTELLARLESGGVAVTNATISLTGGTLRVEAGDRAYRYDPAGDQLTPIV